MTQLILDMDGGGVVLPESRKGGYTVQRDCLAAELQMVTGRVVRELRGSVWVISYQYGYLDGGLKDRVIAACEKGQRGPIRCGFLTQESAGALTYADFFVTGFQRPKFMWSRGGWSAGQRTAVPMWADFSLDLREVKPHA